jgi:hypothetical protein
MFSASNIALATYPRLALANSLVAATDGARLHRDIGAARAVRWFERYLPECEPTLAFVGLAVAAFSALTADAPMEAVQALRAVVASSSGVGL